MSARARYLTAALATAALLVGSAVATAPAHVKDDNGTWLFTGSTFNSKSATAAERSDPVTLIFKRPQAMR